MARISAEIRSYFATPVAVVTLPDAASPQRRARAGHPRARAPGSGRPAQQPRRLAVELGLRGLGRRAGQAAARRARATSGDPADLRPRRQAGAHRAGRPTPGPTSTASGHGNEFHTHPGAYWSGTYYVDDGGIGDDHALGGEFEMQDPRGVAPAMYAPLLGFAVPGGQSAGASELIFPKSGQFILFPSWLQHGGPALSRRADADLGGLQFQGLSAVSDAAARSGSSPTAR